jgi:hypothetical protein
VANLSAAALETARPVNEAQQAADESRARDAAQEAEQREQDREAIARTIHAREEEHRRSRVDVMA